MIKEISHQEISNIIQAVNAAYYDDGGLEGINRYLSDVNITSEMSITEMITYVRAAATGSEHMPHHARLVSEIKSELQRRGESEKRISRLLVGLF